MTSRKRGNAWGLEGAGRSVVMLLRAARSDRAPGAGGWPGALALGLLVASVALGACGGESKPPPPAPARDAAVDRSNRPPTPDAAAPSEEDAPVAVDAQAEPPDAPPDTPPPEPKPAPGTVPAPWKAYLVGEPEGGGSADFAAESFSVKGSGRDIYDVLGFTFVAQPFTGDGEIVAQIDGLTGDAVSAGAKAGVMLMAEDGLINPSAAWAGTFVTPRQGAAGQWRADTAGVAATSGAGVEVIPGWVKLSKVGSEVSFAYSPDGVLWIPFGSAVINGFGPNLLVGLGVSGRDTTGLPQVTATVARVKVTPYPPGQAPDGGAVTGAPGDAGIAGSDGPLPGGPVPREWTTNDIGTTLPGSASFQNGRFLLAGGGRDIWARADNGVFVWQRIRGDAEIIARVLGVQPTNLHAKAGLMFRASLDPGDVNTMWLAKPVDPVPGSIVQGLSFQWRPAVGENSTARNQRFFLPPQTLRLARKGLNIEASVLLAPPDRWFLVSRQALDLPEDIYVGLAVTSHDVNLVATGAFEGVRVTGTPAPPLPDGGLDTSPPDAGTPDAPAP
jgi:hypothetical protein